MTALLTFADLTVFAIFGAFSLGFILGRWSK